MGQEIIQLPTGQSVSVQYGNETKHILRSKDLSPILQKAVDITNSGLKVARIFIEARDQMRLSVQFYDAYNRYIREDVIPVTALAAAMQAGRNTLDAMNLDEDIYSDAFNDLEERRRRRRQSY